MESISNSNPGDEDMNFEMANEGEYLANKLVSYENIDDIEKLRKMLHDERQDRKETEERAMDVLKSIKERYAKKITSIRAQYESQYALAQEELKLRQVTMEALRADNERLQQTVNEDIHASLPGGDCLTPEKSNVKESKFENRFKVKQAEIDSLNNQISQKDSLISELKKHNRQLTENLESIRDELVAQADSVMESLKAQQIKFENERLINKKLQTQIDVLESEKSLLERQKKRLDRKCNQFRDFAIQGTAATFEKTSDEDDATPNKVSRYEARETTSLSRNVLCEQTNIIPSRSGLEKWVCYEESKKENEKLVLRVKELEVLANGAKLVLEAKEKLEKEKAASDTQLQLCKLELETCKAKLESECNLSKQLQESLQKVKSQNEKISKDLSQLTGELKAKQKEVSKLTNVATTLQKTCTELENQANEFEKLYETECAEIKQMTDDIKNKVEEINSLKQQVSSLESRIEKRSAELDEKMLQVRNTESKVADLLDAKFSTEKELIQVKNDLELKNSSIDESNERIQSLERELIMIKEETAGYKTMLATSKAKCAQLCAALEGLQIRYEKVNNDVAVSILTNEKNEKDFEVQRQRFQETISQQLKLIDFLQVKNENAKKPWFSPAKPSAKESTSAKEVEAALIRERAKNKCLSEEIQATKRELQKCVEKITYFHKVIKDSEGQHRKTLDENSLRNELSAYKALGQYADRIDKDSSPSAPSLENDSRPSSAVSNATSATTDNNPRSSPLVAPSEYSPMKRSLNTKQGEKKSQNIEKNDDDDSAEFTFTDSILEELDE